MGFYAPAQLVACAKEHGVKVLPVDVNHSDWDCTIERSVQSSVFSVQEEEKSLNTEHSTPEHSSLRLGLRMISGLRVDDAEVIVEARASGPFTSVADFTQRTKLGGATVTRLSQADAFGSLNQDRREALWQALAQENKPLDQPLFDSLDNDDDLTAGLPEMPTEQQVVEDYRTVGLSLKAHPISFHRQHLDQIKIVRTEELESKKNNQYLSVAGLIILRQRPATAKGITFVTLEDETGTANLVVKQKTWERHYRICRSSPAWIVHGKLEKKSGVIHVVVSRIEDMSQRLNELEVKSRNFR